MPVTNGLPYPLASDAPDGAGAVFALVTALQTYFRAKNTVSQSIASGTWTGLGYDLTTSDPSGSMDASGAVNIALPKAGLYRVLAKAGFNGGTNTTALRGLRTKLFDNGNGTSNPGQTMGIGWVTDGQFELNDVFSCSAGSTLQIEIYQASGSAQTVPGYTDDYNRHTVFVQYLGKA